MVFVFICYFASCFSCLFVFICLPIRLLEQELQAFRLSVQSEQGILEDRCAEMEVTMETLRRHNAHLQEMLKQVSGTL